jgi:hypothetical protein
MTLLTLVFLRLSFVEGKLMYEQREIRPKLKYCLFPFPTDPSKSHDPKKIASMDEKLFFDTFFHSYYT